MLLTKFGMSWELASDPLKPHKNIFIDDYYILIAIFLPISNIMHINFTKAKIPSILEISPI
jgi:hypothetical protein